MNNMISILRSTRSSFLAAVGMAICMYSAQGQTSEAETTRTVDIWLTGAECMNAPQVVWVVRNGADLDSFPIEHYKTCRWQSQAPVTIDIPLDKFSLRLGGSRTLCRRAVAVPSENDRHESVAKLTFRYEPKAARHVTIVLPQSVSATYLREVPKDANVQGTIDCVENGPFRGSTTVQDVMFSREKLRLVFALKNEPRPLQLLIDDEIQKEMTENDKKNRKTVLSSGGIVEALRRQAGQAPRTGSNDYHLRDERVDAAGLKQIELEMVK